MRRKGTSRSENKKDIATKKRELRAASKTEKEKTKVAGLESALPQEKSAPPQKIKKPQFDDLGIRPPQKFEEQPKPQIQKITLKEKARPGQEVKKEKTFVDSYELPAGSNTTSLTLMVRDPFWIYAYWDIAPSSIEELRNKVGSGEFKRSWYTLRMYDVTCIDFNGKNANRWFDIDVGAHTNSWYVNIWNDNVSYCGEIGIRTSDGRFFALARSNFVTTPRAGSSGRSDLIWMELKEGFNEPPYIIVEAQPEASGPPEAEEAAESLRRKIFLTEDDIRAYYSRLFPLLKRFISTRRGREVGRISFRYPLKGGDILLEDFLIRGLSPGQFIKKILLGSSEEMILQGASEFAKGGASEREKKERKFFFDIGAELIVYGRTEPEAEVYLGNKKIKLRSDGTFTLRFALPDGKIPLDFIAQSKDKLEKRRIITEVERSKTKSSS